MMSSNSAKPHRRVAPPILVNIHERADASLDNRPSANGNVNDNVASNSGGPGVSTPAVEQNVKKVGFANIRTSGAAKSVPAKSIPAKSIFLRKNDAVSGSNPTMSRNMNGNPGHTPGPKPPTKSVATKSHRRAHKPHVETNIGAMHGILKASDSQSQSGAVGRVESSESNANIKLEILDDTLPMPNNNLDLHIESGIDAVVVVNGEGDAFITLTNGTNDHDIVGETIPHIQPNSSIATNVAAETVSSSSKPPLELMVDSSITANLPVVHPHLQYCNNAQCAKLHFCLSSIPSPNGFQSSTPLGELPPLAYANGMNGISGGGGDAERKTFLVPGIQEALDQLHGLRNFAMCYNLMGTFERYKGFAEIQAMILERVHQVQQSTE